MPRARTACTSRPRGSRRCPRPGGCAPSSRSRGPDAMRASTAAALGIAAYLVFLAASVPAGFIARRIDGSAVRISEARGLAWKGDAAALAAVSPLVATWRPQGQLGITAPRLAWNGREARGSARIEWHDAAVALADVHPLGTYRVDVEAAGGPAKIALATLDGVLQAKGSGTVDANG